ncbi:MAG: alpha/beta fold hydrolase [Methylococcales bacterium]
MKAVELAYEHFGDKAKVPLIVLHGFFASSRNWRQIAKKLAEYYCVYVVDMRNHGNSPHNPEMDYPLMSEDLKLFMQQRQIVTANILGHSMGGKVAMWFALTYPESVQKLIVVDISPVTYQHSFDQIINALKQLPLEQISNRKQADEYLEPLIPELSYRQFLLQNLQLKQGKYSWRVDLDIFYRTANNIIGFPSVENIAPYKGEVLFIMGGNSTYTNKEAIKQSFPHAKISTVDQASHWLHVEKPARFVKEVVNFL